MEPGDVIDGRFEVERQAEAGAMATVFRARDRSTGAKVALKLLRAEARDEARRFDREVAVLAGLTHPAVVRYVAHGAAALPGWLGPARYLAMEWLEGESLAQRLAREGLSVEEVVELGRRVADGLGALHRLGVVHRDIKPANIVLQGRRVDRATVIDFGVAHDQGRRGEITLPGAMIGTPGYMAPEQARGERSIDSRADVFALGCVLFKCLTGRPLFSGADAATVLAKTVLEPSPRASSLRPDVPPALDSLVAMMTAKRREHRPLDGEAVADWLEALDGLTGPPPATPRPSLLPSLTTRERRVLCVVLARPEGSARVAADTLETVEQVASGELDERLTRAQRDVEALGGQTEIVAGAAVLVTVAGPGVATELCARAARCALAIRESLPEAPIVLATGRGEAGDGRGDWRGEGGPGSRVPVGEVLERAAELLRLPPSPGLRIDDVTAGLLDARFKIESDAEGLILRGEREAPAPKRTLLGRSTPCVGREPEIASLEALFEECVAEPRARAAVILGAAGIGKTRVVHELLARVGGRAEVWSGRGDPMAPGSPFGLIAPALRRAAGVLDGEPLPLRRQKLRARVGRHLGRERDVQRIAEFLGEIAGVPYAEEESVQLRAARRDAMLMGDQMRRAWVDLLAIECAAGPLVLVLEDLHWGDVPSVMMIDAALAALQAGAGAPLLVIALARPELRQCFPALWAERDPYLIQLGPLGRRASVELVRGALGAAADAATAERLASQAGGNPFCLEEMIRAVAAGRREGLPETVLGLVQARLDALPAESRRALRAGSVFGEVFRRGAVIALLGGEDRAPDIDAELALLTTREILVRRGDGRFPGEEEYAFQHALLREAAYAALTEEDRVLGHRLAGAWLEGAGGADPAALAEHFERGGEPLRAAGWYHRAAVEALEGNDLTGALARAARGIACGASGEALGALRRVQAEAHKWRGENEQAEASAVAALELLPRGSAGWWAAAGEIAVTSLRLGRLDRLKEIAAALLSSLEELGEDAAVKVAAAHAGARAVTGLAHAGAHDLAEALLARVEPLAEALAASEPAVIARVLQARSGRAQAAGDVGGYLQAMLASAARFEEAGDARMACNARVGVGYAYLEVGAWSEAERWLREVRAAAAQLGLPQVAATAAHNLGLVLARQGALEEAQALEEGAVEAFQRQGDRRMEAASRSYLAEILGLMGDGEGALREAEAAAALPAGAPVRARALASVARALLVAGRGGEALEAAEQAMELLASCGGTDLGDSFLHAAYVEALHAAGRREDARRAAEVARDRIMQHARRILDPALRVSFLERLPENARILELAGVGAGA